MSDYQYNPNVEQWKAIPGFPGYEVSDHGRIRSFRIWGKRAKGHCQIADCPQRILIPNIDSTGYPGVNLLRASKQYRRRIHSLVLLAFIGPRPQGFACCHSDRNKKHNHLINLRWDSYCNNENDKIKHGTKVNPPIHEGEECHLSKLTTDKVKKIRELASQGNQKSYIAKLFGVTQTNIHDIINMKTWKHIP